MTRAIDTLRLYKRFRDLAYPDRGDGPRAAPVGSGLIDLDRDHESPNELGLSSDEIDAAVDDLLRAELLRRLTPQEEHTRGLDHPPGHHDMLFVRALDDLTAATLLFART